jgi:hypothetical protein
MPAVGTENIAQIEALAYSMQQRILNAIYVPCSRLCGLVVRVPGYSHRGPGFDSRRCQIF